MEILSSVRSRIGFAKRNPKSSEMKVSRLSSKRSCDRPAPIFEETAFMGNGSNDGNNNQNDSGKNDNESRTGRTEETKVEVFGHSRSAIPLSQAREMRTGVDRKLLKKILKPKTATQKTETLELHGVGMTAFEALDSKQMAQLDSQCPSLKNLVLRDLNLYSERRDRKLRLRDFPEDLESLSLHESAVEPSTFFADMDGSKMQKLQVLDLSRALFIGGRCRTSSLAWPRLENLRELYTEGVLRGRYASSLENLLESFPSLQVLDLESAELSQDALVSIARLLPNIRELYLGQSGLTDAAMMRVVLGNCSLDRLQTICLCETNVTHVGLAYLIKACPSLRSITCRRSTVGREEAEALEESVPGLTIKRVEITHIFASLRDRCCDHYATKHGRSLVLGSR